MLPTERVSIGLVQTEAILADKRRNLETAVALLDQLAGRATVACLPELFTTGYNLDLIGAEFARLAHAWA